MTNPTLAIYGHIMSDSAKVANPKGESTILFDKKDLEDSLKKIKTLDYHQELEYNGIKFTCYNAGHVLGAAMFLVEIDGVKVLYTGDYSCEEDRHLQPAEIPNTLIDVLIVESTYGVKELPYL
jgi:cleavage and polyadenylation specificity factor subunit 3